MTSMHTLDDDRRNEPAVVPAYGGDVPEPGGGHDADGVDAAMETDLPREAELAREVEAWNRTDAPYPRDLCIHDLFAAQVARTPGAEAVLHEGAALTYAQLDARANRIARRLRRLGVGPEARVGICLERGSELVAAMLGVLKAGGAYVPLDPAYPAERLAFTLLDAGVAALVTQDTLRGLLPVPAEVHVVSVDGDAREIAAESARAPRSGAGPRNLAYLIYTSGSTGVPKAVAIEHGSVVALLSWAAGVFTGEELGGVLASTSICFDLSVFEIFLPLSLGGRAIVVENALAVATSVHAGEVRLVNTVPSAIAALLANGGIPASVKTVNLAGEPLHGELVDALYARGGIERVYDLYGPSEDTTYSTWTRRAAGGPATIGRPIANTRAYVLDGAMRPVAPGAAGELYLGGSGLARGYLGRPSLTAERFVPDPFGPRAGGRLYRTGDRVRWREVPNGDEACDLADGSTPARRPSRAFALEFLGRLDAQVKVRGFRIELGEVEARLREHAGVREAVVVAREDAPGDRRLAAYLVPDPRGVDEMADAGEGDWEAGHQAEWSAAWDWVYREPAGADPTFDVSGWNSSFTGEPLPAEEMREWVEATVARIAALRPRRVLEIGCGTGLLLWRLAPGCERYVGTDISARVVEQLRGLRARRPELGHVEVVHRAADDFAGLEPASFDTVVINSVVQYFPGLGHLSRVLEGAARLVGPGGRVFVGDVRDLRLLGAFRTAVETHASPPGRPVAEWRERAEQAQAQETELVVDPAFFRSLARDPATGGSIGAVETLQKRGRFANELTAFRYDVVLHVGPPQGGTDGGTDSGTDGGTDGGAGEEGGTAEPRRIDWRAQGLTLEALEARLAAEEVEGGEGEEGASLVVAGIPNARVAGALEALAIRRDPRGVETVADVRRRAAAEGVDPEALWRLGEARGWTVDVRLADDPGRMDARFARGAAARRPFAAPLGPGRSVPGVLATDPLRGRRARVLVPALRRHLAGRLPAYMAPAAYVVLDAMPLTPNGKIDRKALPAPGAEARADGHEAPEGATEAVLAGVWAEVLGVERVGRRDHFFEIGGHSLAAMQVISRVGRLLGAEVAQGDLFDHPVLADFARFLEGAARADLLALEPVDRGGRLPLSFAQARLWFVDQLGGAGAAYHVALGLRLHGTLDRAALVRALDRVVARHEALRTVFAEEGGEPVQRIAPAQGAAFPLAEDDLCGVDDAEAALARLAEAEAQAPFALERGPLARGRLVRLDGERHVLLVTMHHIVSDGWSMGVLADELSALYAAFVRGEADPLPPLPAQYAEYVAWQRRWVGGEVLRRHAAYWREALAGAPALLELPADRPRPPQQDHAGAVVPVVLGRERSAALRALGRRHGATPFMTVLAGWAALLGRLAGQRDVVVGTPAANRPRTELEGLIGLFLNTLALRADLAGAPTAAGLLARVKARALAAQQHQHLPFEQVVELLHPARSLSHTPVFQAFFTWENVPQGRFDLPGVRVTPLERAARATAKFDLSLFLEEEDGRIVGGIEYATSLFDRETVERWAGFLGTLLEGMAADDGRPVDRLALLSGAERRALEMEAEACRVRPVNPYTPFAAEAVDQPIHRRFRAQVDAHPQRTALRTREGEWSYAQLDALARGVARGVASALAPGEGRVGLLFDPGAPMVAAVLGTLAAGKTYVPLDPAWPEPRMRRVLADAGAALILAGDPHVAAACRLAEAEMPDARPRAVLRVDARLPSPAFAAASEAASETASATPSDTASATPSAALDTASDTASDIAPDTADAGDVAGAVDTPPGAVAYLLYTSGSTGEPKGVAQSHRNVLGHIRAYTNALRISPGDRVALVASYATDAAVMDLFGALLNGASLHLFDVRAEGVERLAPWLRAEAITLYHSTPTLFRALVGGDGAAEGFPGVRLVVLGGEAVFRPDFEGFRRVFPPGAILVNGLGPTESTLALQEMMVHGTRTHGHGVPAGRAVEGAEVLLLDDAGEPAEAYVPAEIVIRGPHLALGYWRRPAATARAFVPDPAVAGGRMYRTGDVGRRLADGRVEFVGRRDEQVKVRGYRVEPDEVAAVLRRIPGVRAAAVVARDDAPGGGARLAAYVVADEAVATEALRARLAERLPEYMVPAAYVRLDALPLTSSGKLDRRALPAPDDQAYARRGHEPPQGEVERTLAAAWAELLGVGRVGRRDDFFALGGHSLLAVQAVSRVRRALGVEAAVRDLFRHPVLADFARFLGGAARAAAPAIVPVEGDERTRLSFAQQRLWFLEQMGGVGSAYHVGWALRLRGAVDRAALLRALDRIAARHEALRTTFARVDGEPVQRIAPAGQSGFRVVEHDLRGRPDAGAELARIVAAEDAAPFDLEAGPLARARLARVAGGEHVLVVRMHHAVSDAWSTGVFLAELGALYAAFHAGRPDPLPPLAIQYADWAAWQRRRVAGEVLEAQARYWTHALAGAPELLELPADRPRPARQDHAGGSVPVEFDGALAAGLGALARRHGATLFMTLLAGWAAVLARLSGQGDVVVGTPSANREREEVEGLIGFFVDTLALRIDLHGAPTVAELLARVRARALEARQHADIPFEQVVERVRPARSPAYTPLFQVMLTWHDAPPARLDLPRIEVERVDGAGDDTAKFDLSLSLGEAGGRITGELAYATALFDRATAERYAGYLRAAVAAMAADDTLRVDDLPLLAEAERRRVVEEWNATAAAYPAHDLLHRLVAAQARRTPGAVAVVHEGVRLTYAQVDGSAARLARALRGRGVGRGAFVPVLAERGPAAPVAMLAAMKAGAAFVPLDPAWPDARLRAALGDLDPAAVLADAASARRAAALGRPVLVAAVEAGDGEEGEDGEVMDGGVGEGDAIYAIYTSGSTGLPKAAVVHHGGIANRFGWMSARFGAGSAASVLQTTRHVFDSAVWQLFWPLVHGGRTVIPRGGGEADASHLLGLIEAEGVTMTDFVPSVFNALVPDLVASEGARARLASLRTVVVGGEQITAETTWRFLAALPAVRVVNLYGPTECSIGSICHEVRPGGGEPIAIGTPISNTRALLLDGRGRPVPRGAAGEIHLGGRCVGLGYRGDPRRTAAAFVPDPFGEPGARLYRTGDLGRHRADGSIEFLGRIDQQVKVRGVRIEPGEVETRLRAHPAVREAAVVAREDVPGERRLVAYLVGEPVDDGVANVMSDVVGDVVDAVDVVDADALRAHLAAHLAGPMIPAAFVWLRALPLTPGGKLDRRALPAPEGDDPSTRPYEPPAGPVEATLAGIWAEVLGVERVGRRDHFFDRGGHSLLAVRLVSRVRRLLGAGAALRDVFERPVLADFARALAGSADASGPPIEPTGRGGRLPLSPAQQRLWFLEQLDGPGGAWHVSERLRLRGPLDVAALGRALVRIAARHEALRTTFAAVDGEAEQRIAPAGAAAFPLTLDALAHDADADAALARIVAREARAPFDLERGPLARGRLVRLGDDHHTLLLTLHHLVSDGWSTDVLVHELGALYGAFARGEGDPLPPLAVHYADYAAWHRRRLEGDALHAQAGYWRRALAGAPALLALPADRVRPARHDPAGETLPVAFDERTSAAVRALSRRHGTTPFMTVLAAWAAVLGRLAGADDVVVGTPSANRGREEVEGLIGYFADTLALRVELAGSPSSAQLLARVRARTLEAQQHADLPFERMVELLQPARSLAHHPLFQVMFSWSEARRGGAALPGLHVEALEVAPPAAARFDLWLALGDAGGRIGGDVTFAAALFDPATVERWLGSLARLLREMEADDARPVERLPLLSAGERRRVLYGWNATEAEYPREPCIHQLFEAQAARTPEAVAVEAGGAVLTYAELDARAGRLARRLRALGVGPESRVALCVERGAGMVVALLGVLKAGGAYVPLDPAHPAHRLGQLLCDCAPAAVLVHGRRDAEVDGLLGGLALPVVEVAGGAEPEDYEPSAGLAAGAENAAYVMYTSGSTGRPKGVVVPHRGVVNLLRSMRDTLGMEPADRVLALATYAFDMSVPELLLPLVHGARTVVLPRELAADPAGLAEAIRAHAPTVMQATPSTWRMLVEWGWEGAPLLRAVCGAEAILPDLARTVRSRVGGLWNLYGPTETTVWSTAGPVGGGPAGGEVGGEHVPVGRPLANTRVYVLDRFGEPVPVGAPGEISITGDGVARGYLRRPSLTAERFVPDPFGPRPGARMYRTGDLGRWRHDGTIEFLGRVDHQVKVRGHRIEPGEIEARLAEHPGVRHAVVVARGDPSGGRRLVAYCVAEAAVEVESLRAHLAGRLPAYMVPAAYVRLERLPLTPNGKVDRGALPAPADDAYARRGHEAPVGATEEALARIWGELLGLERVGRGDDFFELGGHSLLALRVASRASERFQARVSATELFFHPRLADLARAVDEAARSGGRAGGGAGEGGDDDGGGGGHDGVGWAGPIRPYSVDMLSDGDVDTLLAELLSKRAGA